MDLSSPHAAARPASDGGLVENAAIGGGLLRAGKKDGAPCTNPVSQAGSAGVAVARILVGSVYYNNTTTTTDA